MDAALQITIGPHIYIINPVKKRFRDICYQFVGFQIYFKNPFTKDFNSGFLKLSFRTSGFFLNDIFEDFVRLSAPDAEQNRFVIVYATPGTQSKTKISFTLSAVTREPAGHGRDPTRVQFVEGVPPPPTTKV